MPCILEFHGEYILFTWLMVMTVKKMPPHEANRFFELLRTKMDRIFRKRSYPLTAEQLLRLLVDALAEFIY